MSVLDELLAQRDAVLFGEWVRQEPEDDGEACLVARYGPEDLFGMVSNDAAQRLDAVVACKYPFAYLKAWFQKKAHQNTVGECDPVCVFWNDRYATREQVIEVLDEALRQAKEQVQS